MPSTQHAHDLARFLAPMLEQAQDLGTGLGWPDGFSYLADADGFTGPAVDFAILLELQEVRKKALLLPPSAAGERPAGQLGERLTEVLEGDEHAVGVLWALLAGGEDQPGPSGPHPSGPSPAGNGTRPGRPEQKQKQKQAPSPRSIWVNVCMNAIVALVLALAGWLAWPPLQLRPQAGVLSLEVFAVWSLSFLPGWLYIRFLGQRAGSLWHEYVLNLHRLGWDRPRHLPRPPVNSDFYAEWQNDGGALLDRLPNIYQQKFDAYYGRSVSRSGQGDGSPVRVETLFPVFLATTALAVCWTAVLWNPRFTSAPASVWDMLKFGFLGAYSFILQMLVRRFFQSDLRPSAYANALLRLIVVLILVAALYQILPQSSPRSAAAIAFVVGFFPLVGMQALQRVAATALRVVVPSLSPPYPLNQIDGLSVWYEARLIEEGIEDMQSLATANFVDVILHTRVPVGRLVDWVDQAHLYLHLDRIEGTWRERRHAKSGETATLPAVAVGSVTEASRAGSKTRTALRQFGIRNATDLLKAFPPEEGDPARPPAPGSPWQVQLAAGQGGLDSAQLRTIVRVLDQEPALAPVWNWQNRGVRRHVPLARGVSAA
jgi:hypothetical protein